MVSSSQSLSGKFCRSKGSGLPTKQFEAVAEATAKALSALNPKAPKMLPNARRQQQTSNERKAHLVSERSYNAY